MRQPAKSKTHRPPPVPNERFTAVIGGAVRTSPLAFYARVMGELLDEGCLTANSEILVLCGGTNDRWVLESLGFTNVTISSLDSRMEADSLAPFGWSYQNAEKLTYEDGTFDFVVVHSGLHHCYSPHRAIGEMLRVSRRGIVVFEPKDGFFTWLGVKLGFGQQYEDSAVFRSECRYGGVLNTEIPNFVYRFTAREIEKTVNSFLPEGKHQFRFYWAMRIPWHRLEDLRNPVYGFLVRLVRPMLTALGDRSSFFANNLGCFVRKATRPQDLHPWIRVDEAGGTHVDVDWLRAKYSDG